MTKTQIDAKRIGQQVDAALAMSANYSRMLKLATELGMEYEIERMAQGRDEFSGEADCLVKDAIQAGLEPEDLDEFIEEER